MPSSDMDEQGGRLSGAGGGGLTVNAANSNNPNNHLTANHLAGGHHYGGYSPLMSPGARSAFRPVFGGGGEEEDEATQGLYDVGGLGAGPRSPSLIAKSHHHLHGGAIRPRSPSLMQSVGPPPLSPRRAPGPSAFASTGAPKTAPGAGTSAYVAQQNPGSADAAQQSPGAAADVGDEAGNLAAGDGLALAPPPELGGPATSSSSGAGLRRGGGAHEAGRLRGAGGARAPPSLREAGAGIIANLCLGPATAAATAAAAAGAATANPAAQSALAAEGAGGAIARMFALRNAGVVPVLAAWLSSGSGPLLRAAAAALANLCLHNGEASHCLGSVVMSIMGPGHPDLPERLVSLLRVASNTAAQLRLARAGVLEELVADEVGLLRRAVDLWWALGGPAALVRLLGHKLTHKHAEITPP
eukprot:XP_001702248.1 predicted protein [Chlamydomonas reinhardtii]